MEASLSDLLLSGLKLMLAGMSIVFLFLALLVGVIGVIARLVKKDRDQTAPNKPVATHDDQAELIAVIGAALRRYRGS